MGTLKPRRRPCEGCARRRELLKLAGKKLIIKIKPKGKSA